MEGFLRAIVRLHCCRFHCPDRRACAAPPTSPISSSRSRPCSIGLTPNDKLATYGARRSRGRGRRLPFHRAGEGRLQGLDRRRRGGLRHLARLPADRPDQVQGQVRAGRGRVPPAPLAVLQEDADRARLRREAQRARLHGLFATGSSKARRRTRPPSVPIMPWGNQGDVPKCADWVAK